MACASPPLASARILTIAKQFRDANNLIVPETDCTPRRKEGFVLAVIATPPGTKSPISAISLFSLQLTRIDVPSRHTQSEYIELSESTTAQTQRAIGPLHADNHSGAWTLCRAGLVLADRKSCSHSRGKEAALQTAKVRDQFRHGQRHCGLPNRRDVSFITSRRQRCDNTGTQFSYRVHTKRSRVIWEDLGLIEVLEPRHSAGAWGLERDGAKVEASRYYCNQHRWTFCK